ncbi:MAG: type II toxin-antitoxin system prevent-host-death family antitoxin [Alphaproteobacteria bacterium]|nr:type II toxin-antitoxin system prevent-host-death family antitoxin [Alphaproteobacteria bacterium]
MGTIDLAADAAVRLSDLVDRVQPGEVIDIIQRGKTVARLVSAKKPRKPVDVNMLRSLTDSMPRQTEDAADLVRSMRDTDRY